VRVFLTCVGDRDPYWGEKLVEGKKQRVPFDPQESYNENGLQTRKGPVLSFLEESLLQQGDYIYLIPTKKEPEKPNADRLRSETWANGLALEKELSCQYAVKLKPLVNLDIGDFEQVIPALRNIVTEVKQEFQSQDLEWVVLVSPGTPQMQAAWYVLANEGTLPAQLYRITDQGEVSSINVDPLFEQEWKHLALKQFRAFTFQAASQTLTHLAQRALSSQRREAAQFFSQLAEAYSLWQIFEYDQALRKLRGLTCPNWLDSALVSLLKNQKEKLSALCRQNPPMLQAKAIDLYHGARLKQAIGEYTDAIWRAASAYEQVLIERALEALKGELGHRPNPYRFKESLGQIYKQNQNNLQRQRQLEIMRKLAGKPLANDLSAEALLERMEPFLGVDPAGKILRITGRQFEMEFFLNVLQDLLRVRNNAVHRVRPVLKEEVERGLELVREAMRKQFGDSIVQEIENYALSKESLEQIADAMERLL
jgi:hypothetical protein